MKNSSSTLITAKQTLVTCLNCKGTGIVEMWHVPGINKVWPKQPSEEEIQIQSIKEAEEAVLEVVFWAIHGILSRFPYSLASFSVFYLASFGE